MKVSEHKPFRAVKTFFESDLAKMAEDKIQVKPVRNTGDINPISVTLEVVRHEKNKNQ